MRRFFSNGKLLLTGEYVVLDGAQALAVPTAFGQDLIVKKISQPQLIWQSFTHDNHCWFEATFDVPKIRLVSCSFDSETEENNEVIGETLQKILHQAKILNHHFLESTQGFYVTTKLDFPKNWGLGSSSTLINNIAQWAKIDAYTLLWNSFSGSAYDIACAQHNTPILYQVKDKKPIVKPIHFAPNFSDELFFVHLNKKQNSRKGIERYKNLLAQQKDSTRQQINEITELSNAFLQATNINDFNKLITHHEELISSLIQLEPVKKSLFPDYFGEIKSLGAWGGDFLLASGNNDTIKYFQSKGYQTILPYHNMVLQS